MFAIVFLLNLFLIVAGSSGAVPFGELNSASREAVYDKLHPGTMLLIALLWFGISAPLSAIGAYFGNKHGVRYQN